MAQKKRQRRKDARPEEIIAAALAEFGDKGYAATSIGSIAARAEIARSTVYLYFEDKEALIKQAFEERIGAVFDAAQSHSMAMDLPFQTMFEKMLMLIYARVTQPDTLVLLRILIAEGTRFPDLTDFYHQTILSRAEKVLDLMLTSAIAKGEVRAEVAQYDRKLIIAPVIVAGIWQLTFSRIDPIDLPEFIKGHVDIMMNGLLAR